MSDREMYVRRDGTLESRFEDRREAARFLARLIKNHRNLYDEYMTVRWFHQVDGQLQELDLVSVGTLWIYAKDLIEEKVVRVCE